MSNALSAVATTATVVGFIVLFVLLLGLTWLVSVWYDEWAYRRRRRRKHDVEWDNLRSAWIFHDRQDRIDTQELPMINPDRVNTDVLDFTVEQIYDYQKEHRNDVA